MSIKVAAAQIRCVPGDISGNIKKLGRYAKYAKSHDVKIICTPELYITGYNELNKIQHQNMGIEIDRNYSYSDTKKQCDILDSIAKICINNKIDIITGLTELKIVNGKKRYYNVAIWMGYDGNLRHIYRKTVEIFLYMYLKSTVCRYIA